jgi:hypothetical protein
VATRIRNATCKAGKLDVLQVGIGSLAKWPPFFLRSPDERRSPLQLGGLHNKGWQKLPNTTDLILVRTKADQGGMTWQTP